MFISTFTALKRRLLVLILLLLAGVSFVKAQQPVWQNLGIDQGLPDPNITAIVKASDGKLYIGTAIGLYSYDGFTFQKVVLSAHNKINPYINALSTDGKALFVGARDALIRLDLKTYSAEVLMNPLSTIGGSMGLYFNALKSRLYSFSHGGFLILNIESGKLQVVDSVSERTILKLRIVSDIETHAFCSSKKFISIRNKKISTLFADKDILEANWWEKENAWLVAKADGLYLLEGNYKALRKINIDIQLNAIENHWLYPDNNGSFWIQAAGRFAFLKSAQSVNLWFFKNEPGNPYSFTSNTAQAFFTDVGGTLWVGGDGTGLSYLTPQSSRILFLTNEDAGVQHFWCYRYEKESKKLLCGTTSGLLEGALENNNYYNRKLYKPAGYDRFSVNAIADLNDAEYLLSVYRAGFWIFNKTTKRFRQLTQINSEIGSLFVFGIRQVSGNRLVLLTQKSAYVLDKKTLKITHFIEPRPNNFSIYTAIEDSRRQFLIAGGFGLQVFNAQLIEEKYYSKNEQKSQSLPSTVIFCLHEVGERNYLLATMGAGLCKYQQKDETFKLIPIVTNPDNIFGIMQIDENTLLLTTSNGLCRYNLVSGESVMLNKSNFLPFNDFNQSAFYHDSELTIVGGEKGMLVINSADAGKVFDHSSKIMVRRQNELIQSLVLQPNEHNLHLELSLSEIVPMAKKRLKHRIVGLDEDWQSLPAGQNKLIYNYLPPGSYTLELQLEDETGLYNADMRSVMVEVKPIFYQTTWFRIVAFLLIITVIFLIVRFLTLMRLRWKLNRMDAERKIMLERSRISRELHDNLGSQLTYMISGLETTDLLLKRNKIDKTALNLEKLQLAARESMQQLRDSIWALNPGKMTLNSLITQYEKWLSRITEPHEQIRSSFVKPDCADFEIDPIIGLNVFRIMQEAVHNALKHAKSTELQSVINCDDTHVYFWFSDNGIGFARTIGDGTGLDSMQQRAESLGAKLKIESEPVKGTQISFSIGKNTLKG